MSSTTSGVGASGSVHGLRALEKESDRSVHRQGLHGEDVLAGDVEDSAARDDDRQSRRRSEQLQQRSARRHDVLQVVEDEQELAIARPVSDCSLERFVLALGDSERMRDRRQHELWRAQGRELDEGDAVCEETVAVRCEGEPDPRLPGAARADEREKPHVGTLNQSAQVTQLALATDQRRGDRRQANERLLRLGRRRQLGIVPQDRPLERAKLLAGVEAQLIPEGTLRVAESVECLGLPAGTVERDRQLHAELLSQRVLGTQRGELRDHTFVLAERESHRQQLFPAREAQLLQTPCFLVGETGVQRISECGATPERESPLEEQCSQPIVSLRTRLPPFREEPREAVAVERVGVEFEPVPRRRGGDGVAAEELAKVGDVELDQLRRRRRFVGLPESLPQLVHRARRRSGAGEATGAGDALSGP